MKIIHQILITVIIIGLAAACNSKEAEKPDLPEGVHQVIVKEKKDTDKYSYMKVTEGGETFWIAATVIDVEPDDTLYFSQATEMKDFHSKTFDQTFETILFVEDITKNHGQQKMTAQKHPEIKTQKDKKIDVEPAKNGITIKELYENKKSYDGETVRIRGEVTKFNPNILNKNWLHIQDGTGTKENFDLTVTTQDFVNVGDVVTVEGTVALDQDFGAGYTYDVILVEGEIAGGNKTEADKAM